MTCTHPNKQRFLAVNPNHQLTGTMSVTNYLLWGLIQRPFHNSYQSYLGYMRRINPSTPDSASLQALINLITRLSWCTWHFYWLEIVRTAWPISTKHESPYDRKKPLLSWHMNQFFFKKSDGGISLWCCSRHNLHIMVLSLSIRPDKSLKSTVFLQEYTTTDLQVGNILH